MTNRTLNSIANELLQEDYAGDYDGEDLINSLIVLQQVAHSLAWRRDEVRGTSMDERLVKAEKFGLDLRTAIINFSGIDPRTVVDDMGKDIVSVDIVEK